LCVTAEKRQLERYIQRTSNRESSKFRLLTLEAKLTLEEKLSRIGYLRLAYMHDGTQTYKIIIKLQAVWVSTKSSGGLDIHVRQSTDRLFLPSVNQFKA
jgi:hypothetical protein